jgi:hypothetical protein
LLSKPSINFMDSLPCDWGRKILIAESSTLRSSPAKPMTPILP